jgi:hypothetical protein
VSEIKPRLLHNEVELQNVLFMLARGRPQMIDDEKDQLDASSVVQPKGEIALRSITEQQRR